MRLVEETVLQKDMQQARPLNEATSPYNLWLYFGRGANVETTTSVELRHSGIGIAAICISVFVLLGFLFDFAIASFLRVSGGASPAANTAVGFGLIAVMAIDLLAIGLAVAALFDKKSKKLLPILGLTIGVGSFLIMVAVVSVGLAMRAR